MPQRSSLELGFVPWTILKRISHKCSMGLMSGLWRGQSKVDNIRFLKACCHQPGFMALSIVLLEQKFLNHTKKLSGWWQHVFFQYVDVLVLIHGVNTPVQMANPFFDEETGQWGCVVAKKPLLTSESQSSHFPVPWTSHSHRHPSSCPQELGCWAVETGLVDRWKFLPSLLWSPKGHCKTS